MTVLFGEALRGRQQQSRERQEEEDDPDTEDPAVGLRPLPKEENISVKTNSLLFPRAVAAAPVPSEEPPNLSLGILR